MGRSTPLFKPSLDFDLNYTHTHSFVTTSISVVILTKISPQTDRGHVNELLKTASVLVLATKIVSRNVFLLNDTHTETYKP